MIPGGTERAARFSLVTLAHEFLLKVLPLRELQSADALRRFVAAVTAIERVRTPELDAVLVRLLKVIDKQTGRRIPTLLERYAHTSTFSPSTCLYRFTACVEELLKYQGVGNRVVQRAVATINGQYSDPGLRLATLAREVGRRPSKLCGLFKRTTGTTLHQYLRNVRLERAVELLATTDHSIKEVWSSIGYNHASDFNHHFKTRFGMSPREFQSRATRVVSPAGAEWMPSNSPAAALEPAPPTGVRVLLVDDHEATRTWLTRYLNDSGYAVSTAASATAGLAQVKHVSPDLIVLDFHLPEFNAIEFLRTMRRELDDSHPPAMVFSADWDVEDQADELLALSAVFVPKLCDLDDFGEIVRTCLHVPVIAFHQTRQAMLFGMAILTMI